MIVVVIQIIQSKFFDKIYNLSHSKDFSKELFPPHNADQPVQEVGLLEKHEGKEENQKLLTSKHPCNIYEWRQRKRVIYHHISTGKI